MTHSPTLPTTTNLLLTWIEYSQMFCFMYFYSTSFSFPLFYFDLSLDLLLGSLLLLGVVSRERVVHAAVSLKSAKLFDGFVEGVGHVAGLGRGIVTVTDVDLAVGLFVVADDENEVVFCCVIRKCNFR